MQVIHQYPYHWVPTYDHTYYCRECQVNWDMVGSFSSNEWDTCPTCGCVTDPEFTDENEFVYVEDRTQPPTKTLYLPE